MGRKRNRVIEKAVIGDMAAEGKCVYKSDNKVIFVSHAAPGDVADLRIVRKKKSFEEAVIQTLHTPSPIRLDPFCPEFGLCGGCKWQHIPYDKQIASKQQQVVDALTRIGKLTLPEINPIIGSEKNQYYRNKLEFTFTNQRWLTDEEIASSNEELSRDGAGFHIPGRFDKVLDIEECFLQDDLSNQIRNFVRDKAKELAIPFYNLSKHTGVLRNLIIRNTNKGHWMVILCITELTKEVKSILEELGDKYLKINSLNYVINTKKNDTIFDLEIVCTKGQAYIEEDMEGLNFRIGPKSFFQTNSEQALILYQKTREFAAIKEGDVVYDLYTGTGTIANFVAKLAKKVVGIEYVEMAIADAKVNSQINGIDNTSFYAGDMKDIFTSEFIAENGKPNVIITDPPRAGMHKDVVEQLLMISAPRIVYVSCNASTQARDLELLSEKYTITKVQPVDMFPHTHHVENIVLLELTQNME